MCIRISIQMAGVRWSFRRFVVAESRNGDPEAYGSNCCFRAALIDNTNEAIRQIGCQIERSADTKAAYRQPVSLTVQLYDIAQGPEKPEKRPFRG